MRLGWLSPALLFAPVAAAQGVGLTGNGQFDSSYRRFTEEVRLADNAMRDVQTIKPDAPKGPKSEACVLASRAASMYAIALSDGRSLPTSASDGPRGASGSVGANSEMVLSGELSKVGASARKAKDAKTAWCMGAG